MHHLYIHIYIYIFVLASKMNITVILKYLSIFWFSIALVGIMLSVAVAVTYMNFLLPRCEVMPSRRSNHRPP